ncbi:MAG TPA: tripartite tricarboxylate transporter substrate-binding protein [Xanthobacteraceae bacterium]|nr:tripartite tricarboxylate transporter substrate-binding protein [Xanthobacteraceae bacterium]
MRRARGLLLVGWLLAGLGAGPSAAEEGYPSRLVRVIVPFPPGSTLDALARIVTDQLAHKWAQPVIIENISGGGGNIGTDRFARSPPDGYTLMFSPPGPLTINQLLYGDVAYDPAKFVPITLLARVPNVLITRNNLGAASVADLIALARADPGKLTYASQGVGSTAFLTAKLFETRADVRMAHVPYRGAGPALTDIVAGHVDMMFDTIVTSLPLHRAGSAKILAIANAERSSALPQVPTFAESGMPDFRSITWFGCVAPPGTPASVAEKVQRDLAETLARPAVAAKLIELMLEPVASTPAQAAQFFVAEAALWGKVIRDTGAKAQ